MLNANDLVDDLAIYLGLPAVDTLRAILVLELTLLRARGVVASLPDTAKPIILDVAARGYINPQDAASETVGPFGRTFRMPGVYFTKQERADLLALVGQGRGAFTIRPGVVAR